MALMWPLFLVCLPLAFVAGYTLRYMADDRRRSIEAEAATLGLAASPCCRELRDAQRAAWWQALEHPHVVWTDATCTRAYVSAEPLLVERYGDRWATLTTLSRVMGLASRPGETRSVAWIPPRAVQDAIDQSKAEVIARMGLAVRAEMGEPS